MVGHLGHQHGCGDGGVADPHGELVAVDDPETARRRCGDPGHRGRRRAGEEPIGEWAPTELLFWGTFLLFLGVRAFNPEVFWGEKPMDFSFLNALSRATTLPPPEPWFSGSTLHCQATAATNSTQTPTMIRHRQIRNMRAEVLNAAAREAPAYTRMLHTRI